MLHNSHNSVQKIICNIKALIKRSLWLSSTWSQNVCRACLMRYIKTLICSISPCLTSYVKVRTCACIGLKTHTHIHLHVQTFVTSTDKPELPESPNFYVLHHLCLPVQHVQYHFCCKSDKQWSSHCLFLAIPNLICERDHAVCEEDTKICLSKYNFLKAHPLLPAKHCIHL